MRVPNFVAGPSTLPECVLEQIRHELLDFQGTGKSILETSHRSPEFEAVLEEANWRLRRLLGVGDDYAVLWLQGGASLQFAMLPLNRLQPDEHGAYLDTGTWSSKAIAEARQVASARVIGSSASTRYDRIPDRREWAETEDARYLHLTSNNTIYGTQHASLDIDASVPLVADVSSDFLSRPLPARRFAMLYAGAQKNLGPAGVTVVIGRRDWLQAVRGDLPTWLRYDTHVDAGSLYNTPPVFPIYACGLVLRWIEAQGGLAAMAKASEARAASVYSVIDAYPHVYSGHAVPGSRSNMNITFRLASEAWERHFLEQAAQEGFAGLAGHRSVGGVRVSLYNAVRWEWVTRLTEFMEDFAASVE